MTRFTPTTPIIGFACLWDEPQQRTWSHIPWQLLQAMQEADPGVVDLDLRPSRVVRASLRGWAARSTPDGLVTVWRSSAVTDWWAERRLSRAADAVAPSSVVQVGELWRCRFPGIAYRDVFWSQIARLHSSGIPLSMLGHPGLSRNRLRQRAEREKALLTSISAVATFSNWAKRCLTDDVGISPHIVHVVPPGLRPMLTEGFEASATAAREARQRTRLLFVGRDFRRKGGPDLLRAFRIVRDRRPETTLTIIGPARWPMDESIPQGVAFLGQVEPDAVVQAFSGHDLFVMPSHFEPFGIVFLEALAAGLPSVARRTCAMPEIIEHGQTGLLVDTSHPEELAGSILEALDDDELFRTTAAGAASARERHTWSRTAEKLLALGRQAASQSQME